MDKPKTLTEAQTAELLGISKASVRNWERHGYLTKQSGRYSNDEAEKLLAKIQTGEIERLNSRANKKQATGTIRPPAEFRSLCEKISKITLGIPEVMFLVTLKQFVQSGLAADLPPEALLNFNPEDYSRALIRDHLKARYEQLDLYSNPLLIEAAKAVLGLDLPEVKPSQTDIAGIIYQALRGRGERSVSGSFYTPPEISHDMIASALENLQSENPLFIDPCCGTGQFLLSFIASGGAPENAYGIDADSTAAFTAASNILLQCPEMRSSPRIFTCDSLLDSPGQLPDGFDLTATNPPWGACNSGKRAEFERRFPDISSGESFSYFISRALELTKNGGIIAIVLPESITNVKIHQDIRNHILKFSRITGIKKEGRIFKGVYTPVVTMEMMREDKPAALSPDFNFNINLGSLDSGIIDKIYAAPHTTLTGRAEWALGIVTGDNNRFLHDSASEGLEPVIRGCNIEQGMIKPLNHFIGFNPDLFQQTAPEWKYRASEKLVYRFISKRLVFALDRQRRLTLNSANILLPRADGYSADQIMRLFNSDIYNFLFMKRFNSVKVLRSHLEQLPLPEGLSASGRLGLAEHFNLTESEIFLIKNQLS